MGMESTGGRQGELIELSCCTVINRLLAAWSGVQRYTGSVEDGGLVDSDTGDCCASIGQ